MAQPIISLFTTAGCPKCKILRKRCAGSPIVANSDFREFVIDPSDDSDTNLSLLIENNMTTFPVLLVDNTFMDFGKAMEYLA